MRQINLFGVPYVNNRIVEAMPYMGNKRNLATKIMNAIYATVGGFDSFYDLFGGGGAMSVCSSTAGHAVVYNDLNTGTYNLFKHVLSGGGLPDKWISREDFHKHKNGDDWYSGFVKCVWSFGNNQADYLFGKDVEPTKRLAHLMVIDKSESARKELSKVLGIDIPPKIKTRQQLNRFAKANINMRLEQLERLQQLEQLQLENQSYENVKTKNNSVIYCDPPYQGTMGYQKGIDHNVFFDWCLSNESPVFVSGYNAPQEFCLIAEFEHRTTYSATHNNKVIERLFWNNRHVN